MRKRIIIVIISFFAWHALHAQHTPSYINGQISYLSSENVYVKFASTKKIDLGDTLFLDLDNKFVPALSVVQKSSISCVCSKILDLEFEKGMKIFFKTKELLSQPEEIIQEEINQTLPEAIPFQNDQSIQIEENIEDKPIQKVNGRLSAASYSNFEGDSLTSDPRLRYTFSFKGENLGASKLDLSSYISFRHQIDHWEEVKENPSQAFKIYDLSLSYQIKGFDIKLGRSINRSISNLGAVDGLQINYSTGIFTYGLLFGSKPDHSDYSYNFNLPEAGIFIEHQKKGRNGTLKNTLGVFEQRNGIHTDRRYLYFQHYNTLIKKLFILTSFQVDLYKKINEKPSGDFKITSIYFSARYRINRKIDLFASYDSRQNVIYYETFKNSIDQLIDNETRQGFRLRLNLRPVRFLSTGISANYRIQGNGLSPSKNLYAYINVSRIPFLKASSSLSYNYLETYYLKSNIYGIRLNKDFLKGKLGTGLYYRYFDYHYDISESEYTQQIFGVSLQFQIPYDISFSLNHEYTMGKTNNNHRSYLRLSKRFRY